MKLIKLFNTYDSLQGLISLSKEAAKTDDPPLSFFKQNARNNFFDLEAAFRIFRKTHSEEVAAPLLEIYKSAEDALGKFDFVKESGSEILKTGNLSEEIKKTVLLQEKKAQIELKQFLLREKWLPDATEKATDHLDRMKNILEVDSSDFRNDFIKFLKNSTSKIDAEYRKGELDPHLIEEGIHEIRRKLRWISIYAKIAGGFIQTQSFKKVSQEYDKYLTPEVISSPFTKLPKCPKEVEPIFIKHENFLALSWMIQALGDLKDKGLILENQKHLLGDQSTRKGDKKEESSSLNNLQEISEKALKICDQFFIKDNLLGRIADDLQENKN
ncbi:MAG: hypothetical protein IPK10_00430 [Bacteroidetes bacterium]|nr:hypothetical protein [Bacteroidota bacterium]